MDTTVLQMSLPGVEIMLAGAAVTFILLFLNTTDVGRQLQGHVRILMVLRRETKLLRQHQEVVNLFVSRLDDMAAKYCRGMVRVRHSSQVELMLNEVMIAAFLVCIDQKVVVVNMNGALAGFSISSKQKLEKCLRYAEEHFESRLKSEVKPLTRPRLVAL